MPDIGDKAPDFVLPSTVGEVSLSQLAADSKVLLAFYTEDFTPLCANQVSVLRDDFDILENLGARVLAVSADNVDSHQEFADSLGGVPFPMVADVELAAGRAFGVVDDGEKRSRRAVFVIDRGGTILHAEPWFQPANPTQYEDIFRALGFEA